MSNILQHNSDVNTLAIETLREVREFFKHANEQRKREEFERKHLENLRRKGYLIPVQTRRQRWGR